MLLLAKNYRENFERITSGDLSQMPDYLHAAAELILAWQNGQQNFVLHTSGSTGKPKPIYLQRDKIIYSAQLTAKTFGLAKGDTLFCCLGMNYIAGFMMVMRALVLDCNLYIAPPNGNPLQDVPDDQQLDFAAFVPLQLESIYRSGEKYIGKLNKMKAIMVGGAAVSPGLEEKLQSLQVPVYHTYSMTETYTHVAIRKLNGANKSQAYFPLDDVKLSQDGRGCLVVQSPITDNLPLVTNDLIEFQPYGSFLLLGRIDNLINSGGIKIQAEEVENISKKVMAEMDLPNTVLFAYGLPDEKLGQKLVLFIESNSWEPAIQESFLEKMKSVLTSYKSPKEIIFIETFERTPTGKIDRKATVLKYGNV